MSGKDRLEHYLGSIFDHDRDAAPWTEMERKAKADNDALHHPDLSSGSETLDDGQDLPRPGRKLEETGSVLGF